MKTKLDVFTLAELSIKEYQSQLNNEIRRLEASAERSPLAVFAEYEFSCGSVGALLLIGELSGDLGKFVKEHKKIRNAQKDYGLGECWIEASSKGNVLKINLHEGVSVSKLSKGIHRTKPKIEVEISTGAEKPQTTDDATDTAQSSRQASQNLSFGEQIQALTEKVKQLFQSAKDILAQTNPSQLNADEQSKVQHLQQAIQQWLGFYQQADSQQQQQYGEFSLKLKAQGQKIAQFLQQKTSAQPTNTEPAATSISISQSVGRGGKNLPEEVLLVQQGLNRFKANLAENGICDAKTIAAIEGLERAKLGVVSGLIEPNSKLLKLLLPR